MKYHKFIIEFHLEDKTVVRRAAILPDHSNGCVRVFNELLCEAEKDFGIELPDNYCSVVTKSDKFRSMPVLNLALRDTNAVPDGWCVIDSGDVPFTCP